MRPGRLEFARLDDLLGGSLDDIVVAKMDVEARSASVCACGVRKCAVLFFVVLTVTPDVDQGSCNNAVTRGSNHRPLRHRRRRSAPGPQGYEAHVLEGGAETLLGRRIPFIHTEVGPVMMAGAGSNATAFLERFVQARPHESWPNPAWCDGVSRHLMAHRGCPCSLCIQGDE